MSSRAPRRELETSGRLGVSNGTANSPPRALTCHPVHCHRRCRHGPNGDQYPVPAHPVFDLKAYCKQLVSFYDRYGASRTENSDGRRNHTRIGADIDCKEGNREDGVAAMIKLLESKLFEVPSTPDTEQSAATGE